VFDFLTSHGWDIWSAIAGFLGGGALGSLVTIKVVRGQNASGSGRNVNQTRARARGDIVGGNKSTTHHPGPELKGKD
jgi:hypothetical protein